MRCLSLASYLFERGFQITFLTAPESLATVPALAQAPYNICHDVQGLKADWLIVDNYDLAAPYERAARAWAKKIMVIDDLADRPHACDLLLDQTYGVEETAYRSLTDGRLLLGAQYCLLRDDFRQESQLGFQRDFDRLQTVFVCFGGVNPQRATQWTLQALELYRERSLNIIVCAGGTAENIQSIQDVIADCSQHHIDLYVNAPNVPALMRASDIAIGAGGTMSWERCCMGLPTLAIEVADNQKEVLRALDHAGALMNLGRLSALDHAAFVAAFTDFVQRGNLLAQMSLAAKKICDGRGVERILPYLMVPERSKNGKSLTMRLALDGDCDLLFAWQTEKGARQFARNPEPPHYDSHCAWFEASLLNQKRRLYIVECDGQPCGMTRLDLLDDEAGRSGYEVSILISEDYQGQGIGAGALALLRKSDPFTALWAHILPENGKSIAMFKRAGYEMKEKTWYLSAGLKRMKTIKIGDRVIGEDQPCYIIAEISCNHNGNFDEARRIIEAAAQAGADAVKLQTYKANTITRDFKGSLEGTMWAGTDLYGLYDKAHTPWEWYQDLKKVADDNGVHIFSSPFDETAVDFLMKQNVPAFKIASFEVVDTKLLEYVAKTGKPVIISNGMTDYLEIKEAVEVLKNAGAQDIAVLHCNSGYPAALDEVNLKTIPAISQLFDCPSGLSDHTLFADAQQKKDVVAHLTPIESVKFGAKIIELHLMLDRAEAKALFDKGEGGFDWAFSREPHELKRIVDDIRAFERGETITYDSAQEEAWAKLTHGEVMFSPTAKEMDSRAARPALWVVEDIKKGQSFEFCGGQAGNFDSIRPNGGGLHIRFADFIEGKTASRDITAGNPLSWDMVEGFGDA